MVKLESFQSSPESHISRNAYCWDRPELYNSVKRCKRMNISVRELINFNGKPKSKESVMLGPTRVVSFYKRLNQLKR